MSPRVRKEPGLVECGRRAFLRGLGWVPLLFCGPKPGLAQPATATPLEGALQAAVEAVAETIVPRDQDPGALDAGVPARILAHLSSHVEALTLYRAGLGLLDSLARRAGASSFAGLDQPARERILASLASGTDDSRGVGREFFARVRRDVLAFYWGSVAGQRAVGYRPPLSGYPEYADPPSGAAGPRQ